ncbi:peptidase C14, caspase domain-containing protein [Papiliotrema laurentii]|uniref:Peptidase C14, caspase domain-containing protein n=1 Tax=Papiliotrema laurentii TaxID=5418 RepID=A0AAD9L5Q6_PAPLA|nr:peptidase C14, caspase domain-containing protein [Papiliotrema laurentii]
MGFVAQQPPWGNQSNRPAPPPGPGQPYFEYSSRSGKKKALLIGINYFGTKAQLAGCINDVHNIQRFIQERYGYQPQDMVVLTDDSNDPKSLPTKANIEKAMGWLVDGAQKDDALFFHYSGHGTTAEDTNGDEADGTDEASCPVDYEEAGLIVDDESDHEYLVRPLPAGCRLTAIFDSCHSGTVMDLPYVYSTEGKIKEPNLLEGAQDDIMAAGLSAIRGDSGGFFKGMMNVAKGAFDVKKADAKGRKNNTSPADVIQWAGCKDSQTSADTEEEGKATGAMSYAFIAALTKYPQQSYQQLLVSIREEMRGKYTQKPQLSACHPIDTDLMFVA